MESFPFLKERERENEVVDCDKYRHLTEDLIAEFQERFQDFKRISSELTLFVHPRSVKDDQVERPFKQELCSLRNNLALTDIFRPTEDGYNAVDSYRSISERDYPNLRRHGLKYACMFGSTYSCESFFSKMKFVKNKHRTRLTDDHLLALLRISSSNLNPDIKALVAKMQHQGSD